MASITGALRKLYAKIGGTDTGSQTIAGMIDKVADVAGEGGGGGTVVVTFGPVTSTDGKINASTDLQHDMTRTQIYDALKAGKDVVAKLVVQDGPLEQDFYLPLRSVWLFGGNDLYTIDFKDIILLEQSKETAVVIGMPQEDQAFMSVYYYSMTAAS